jgi:hypothetical protein
MARPADSSATPEHVKQRPVDRRRHLRREFSGHIRLWLDDPLPFEFAGRMMDISAGGFRATHAFPGLAAGQRVRFHHAEGAGFARVVWTRILAGHVETGFMLDPADCPEVLTQDCRLVV